jgi:hypothetical protein
LVIYRCKENDYAKKIEKDGFQTSFILYELKILAQYYKQEGKKSQEIEDLIYEFCKNNICNFNEVKYFRMINKVLNYANKKTNKLIQIENIPVLNCEFEYINSQNIDYENKKVLFCLLIENKIGRIIMETKTGEKQYGIVFGGDNKGKYRDLTKIVGLKKTNEIHKVINSLANDKYVKILDRGKFLLEFINQIDYSDLSFDKDGNLEDKCVCFKMTTFDESGMYFDFYNGDKKVIKCEICGRFILKTINNKKYCNVCSKKVMQEQKNFWKNKNKKNIVKEEKSEDMAQT